MLTISEEKLKQMAPNILEKKLQEYLKRSFDVCYKYEYSA